VDHDKVINFKTETNKVLSNSQISTAGEKATFGNDINEFIKSALWISR
jgi:hypothetical protein